MNAPGWELHRLAGEFRGHWAITVSGNWRLTFTLEGEDAVLVDHQGYHETDSSRSRSDDR